MAALSLKHIGTPRRDIGYIADRNIYLDADGKIVEEDNPAQVRQLVGKGGTLSTADAEKYGLLTKAAAAEAAALNEAMDKPAERAFADKLAAKRQEPVTEPPPTNKPAAKKTAKKGDK